MDKVQIVIVIVYFVGSFLAWLVCRLLCEFKYFWCKRDCKNCGNWKCPLFER